jgi:hypothetical protein
VQLIFHNQIPQNFAIFTPRLFSNNGFPYSCRESDGYGDDGVRFEYKRSEKENMNVVPYNPYLF